MTQDIDLLVAIAQIAGIFVGFGALISVTRRSEIEAAQLGQVRAVVTIGLVVIVASLIPVGLNLFGVAGHDLWATCSAVFLVLIWAVIVISLRRAENRRLMDAGIRTNPVVSTFFWLLLEVPMQVPLILTVLGHHPHWEPAFYVTALVLNLFEAAFVLAQFVYSQVSPEPPEAAVGPDGISGGSS